MRRDAGDTDTPVAAAVNCNSNLSVFAITDKKLHMLISQVSSRLVKDPCIYRDQVAPFENPQAPEGFSVGTQGI